jgi:EmrB/QacA subfamily drug resistance transporter
MSDAAASDAPTKPAMVGPTTPRAVHPDVVLAICCMSLLLVGMDVTIVNVALPSIGQRFGANMAGMQWVIDAYTLVVASFLMLAGATADRVGRRRTFQAGMSLFTAGSLLCSIAPGIRTLIAFRAVQGLGASMLNPVALSIIANVFIEPKLRARAFGIWGTVAGLSLAVGPVAGGFLVQAVGWRSVFWVNLPIGIAAVILTGKFVPESKAAKPRAVDPVGQGLVLIILAGLTSAMIEGHHAGWDSGLILGLFAAAAAAFAGLLWYEPRRAQPLLDLRFFRSVPFSSATVIAVLAFTTFAGFLLLNTLYLQQARGLSALHTGLCTLPMAAGMAVCAPVSAKLLAARGTRLPLLLSGSALALSCLALTQLSIVTPLPVLLATYALFGCGVGLVNPPIANTAVSGMPTAQAGVAAAVASTSRQVGAAMGVAIAGTAVATARSHGMPYTEATHAVWWGLVACGVLVAALGVLSNTGWAKASVARLNHLFVAGS